MTARSVLRFLGTLTLCVALGGGALLSGCGSQDSGGPPELTEGGDDGGGGVQQPTVTLAADRSSIAAGQSVVFSAAVADAQGAPAPAGQDVVFTASKGLFAGGTATTTAKTGADGKATATLTVETAGSTLVTATSAGVSDSKTVTVAAGPVARLVLSASPTAIRANGTDTATLTARYEDQYHNTVTRPDPGTTNGQKTVTFTTGLGTFQGTDGLSLVQVTTTAGVATAALVGGTFGGTASVTAYDGTLSASAVSVEIRKDPVLTVQVSQARIDAPGTSTVTATLLGADGTIAKNAQILFSTTVGTFEGGTGTKTVSSGATGLEASANLVGDPQSPGTALVVASATVGGVPVVSAPARVTIVGAVSRIVLTSAASSARANGRDLVALDARIYDAAGSLVEDPARQVAVGFATDLGTLDAATKTSVRGVASVSLRAPDAPGVAAVSASAASLAPSQVTVTFVAPPAVVVESLTVAASASSIVADPESDSKTRITALVTGASGAGLSGVPVVFRTNAGTLLRFSESGDPLPADGVVESDAAGKAVVYLLSPALMGTGRVTVAAGGFQKQISVQFLAGDTATVTLTPQAETLAADGASATTVRVTSADKNGNPTDDAFVVGVPATGGVSPAVVTTTAGVGSFIYTAGRTAGPLALGVRNANGVGGQATVQLTPPPVGSLSITSGQPAVRADGTTKAHLTITLVSASQQPMGGVVPELTTTLGSLGAVGATDGLGRVLVDLTSPFLGTADVTASYGGKSATVSVDFVAGPPARILVAPASLSLVADGQQTGTFRAAVLDAQGHRVADGTLVSFELAAGGNGTLDAYAKETADGEVTVTYRAPSVTTGSPEGLVISAGAAQTGDGVSAASPTVALLGVTEQVGEVQLAVASPKIVGDGVSTTVVTATVSNTLGLRVADGTPVLFTVPAGKGSLLPTLAPTTATADTVGGVATVVYRSAVTVGPVILTADVGGITQSAAVTLEAGPVAEITLTPSPSRIPPDDTTVSQILIRADDMVGPGGNPVSGTVSLSTDLGTLSAASVALVNGEGFATLKAATGGRAHVTAGMSGVLGSTAVDVGITSAGTPANILFSFTKTTVSVKGVGGDEVTNLDVTVVDEGGNAIVDVADNLTLTITEGPNGGEELVAPPAQRGGTITLTTEGGKASAAFQSGTLPGSVRIQATVAQGGTTISAVAPKITILAGPPFSTFLSRSNDITDNHDGTLTHNYVAVVTDQYGNAVPDGTGVYFGQIANAKSAAADGEILLNVDPVGPPKTGSRFRSASSAFRGYGAPNEGRNVVQGDTLVILSGSEKGGYLVDSVPAADTLQIFSVFEVDGDDGTAGLDFAVGNNFFGVNPNGTIVGAPVIPSVVATKDGVATGANHYAGELVNTSVVIYAETAARRVGDADAFALSWVAPTKVTVFGATDVLSGGTLAFDVLVTDSSTPTPYPVPGLAVRFSSGAGVIGDIVPVTGRTTDGGTVSFTWTAPVVAEDKTYTISVAAGETVKVVSVSVKLP